MSKLQLPTWWYTPSFPHPHSRKYLISSIIFPTKHVWSRLVGSSRPSLPSPQGAARPRAVLIMAPRLRSTERGKALRLACWNADGVRGRKLELEHFLNQHGVDVYISSETFLNPGQAFRLAKYVCHRTDRLTAGGCTAILGHRGIVQHSVPVPGPNHMEATAIQVMLAGRPVKILAAYLSPSHPLIGEDLDACFDGGLPVLLAGDLNAKHVDWNSRLSTRRGKLLRDYADGNTCLIFGPDTPTTNPYNPSTTPDILDIVITKNLLSPVRLTSCSALGSDHLPVLIDTTHRIALISDPLTGPPSNLAWETTFRSIQNYTTRWQSTRALRTSPAPFWRL